MSLIKANSENTFEGAMVFHKEDRFYVYKVNKKSIYIGKETYKNVIKKWEDRVKGTTWKTLMTSIDAKMVEFGVWEISEEEVSKKDLFVKTNEIRKTQKKPISKAAEKVIRDLYKNTFLKVNAKGSYRHPIEAGTDRIIIVLFDKEERAILNINGDRYIFDLKEDIIIPFVNSIHKNGKTINWPVRAEVINEVIKKIV